MGFFIPQTMEKLDNWGLWKLEGGKKKPYSAKYNGPLRVDRPEQWASYEQARIKFKYTEPEYSGLGFLFTEACGLVFIDLDHCINEDSGELSELATNIVQAFAGTYIEYSQSGTGLHIVCKGKFPDRFTSKKPGRSIEIFTEFQYMAFTGNAYEAAEPADKQKELDKLAAFFGVKKREKKPAQLDERPITEADGEIIRRASTGGNGVIFRRLYAGQWQGRYDTQSHADMRLIALIWYYSRNYEQTRRIFLSSGLGQREKARREDYIQRTIETAASNTPAAEPPAERAAAFDRGNNYTVRTDGKAKKQNRGRSYWK